MTIRMGENPNQKAKSQFDKYELTRNFWVSGTTDKVVALQTIAAGAPLFDTVADTAGVQIVVERISIEANEAGGGCWACPVVYSNSPNEYRFSMTSGVQGTKYLTALETIEVYDCGDGSKASEFGIPADVAKGFVGTTNVPFFENAIGVTKDSVEGVDVEIGKLEFSITKKSKSSTFSAAYGQYLAFVTPSVNDDVWSFLWQNQLYIFAKGCLKFRGARINQTSASDLEISHDFAYSKGLTGGDPAWDVGTVYATGDRVTNGGHAWVSLDDGNIANAPTTYSQWSVFETYDPGDTARWGDSLYQSLIGDNFKNDPAFSPDDWLLLGLVPWLDMGPTILPFAVGASAPIVKEGWQYMWPWFKPSVSNGTTVMKPTGIVIQRVFDYSNFNNLQCF